MCETRGQHAKWSKLDTVGLPQNTTYTIYESKIVKLLESDS